MGDSQAPFFNLPPLPGSTGGADSAEKRTGTTATTGQTVEMKAGPKIQDRAGARKSQQNLSVFKILIAVTWVMFFGCLAGILYVLIEYKGEREALHEPEPVEVMEN